MRNLLGPKSTLLKFSINLIIKVLLKLREALKSKSDFLIFQDNFDIKQKLQIIFYFRGT